MLAIDNPVSSVLTNTQNSPSAAQQSVQQSAIGASVDPSAVRRTQEGENQEDGFSFSEEGRRLAGQEAEPEDGNSQVANSDTARGSEEDSEAANEEEADREEASEDRERALAPRGSDGEPLSEGEIEQIRKLQDRDLEVRTHEQAHMAVAGELANGGPKYDYQTGPDGKRYAVGGNVSIDNGVVPNDPQATIQKMTRVKAAALAPAEPSNQDRRVASDADRKKASAQQELTQQQLQEARQSSQTEKPQESQVVAEPQTREASNEGVGSGEPKNRSAFGVVNGTYGRSGGAANSQEQGLGLSIVA